MAKDNQVFNFHEWANTLLAALALLVAGASAYFSYQSNEFKREALAFSGNFNPLCPLKFVEGPALKSCWSLTVINQSDSRIAVIFAYVRPFEFKASDGIVIRDVMEQHIAPLEFSDGQPVEFPIAFEGGEAKLFHFRPLIALDDHVMAEINAVKGKAKTVGELERQLGDRGIDFLGNKVSTYISFFGNERALYKGNPQQVSSELVIRTGRGNQFTYAVSYP